MNDLANEKFYHSCCPSPTPLPAAALYILLLLLLLGLSFAIFILIVSHNSIFLLALFTLSALVIAFLLWNCLSWRNQTPFFIFLRSFPDSDVRLATEGQLVKITGIASCWSASLESSYEKAARCIYASTLLYERRRLRLLPEITKPSCLHWRLAYCERFSTDFYVTDQKSGTRVMVKAGAGSKVIPLVIESKLVNITTQKRILSPHLAKWLRERNLSTDSRVLRLEEGYIQEGSPITVIGMLQKNDENVMIVQPPELVSTGCLWKKLLLSTDIDGLILSVPERGQMSQ